MITIGIVLLIVALCLAVIDVINTTPRSLTTAALILVIISLLLRLVA